MVTVLYHNVKLQTKQISQNSTCGVVNTYLHCHCLLLLVYH